MKLTLDEIISNTSIEPIFINDSNGNFDISTDTRTIKENEIYLAIKGENFDGNKYVEEAIKKGAVGYITSDKNNIFKNAHFGLFAPNTEIAYLEIANYVRNKINPKVVAVTGSSGKTTTKEMLYSVISQKYNTHKSYLNYNNQFGLCKTILEMPENTEVLIIEAGMRALGDVELISKYAQPDIAVLTNIGTSHIGLLKTRENIAIAKCEITKFLKEDGKFIANDSELMRKTNTFKGVTIPVSLQSDNVIILRHDKQGSEFNYHKFDYELNIQGVHNIENALLVIEVGMALDINPEMIKKGLLEYKTIEKRWEVDKTDKYTLINDSYNANPESMAAVLKTFLTLYDAPMAVVLGDMGELGEEAETSHIEIGKKLNNYCNFELITVGNLSKLIYDNFEGKKSHHQTNEDVVKYIQNNVEKGTTILFKASRVMKLEQIVEELKK